MDYEITLMSREHNKFPGAPHLNGRAITSFRTGREVWVVPEP